MLFCLLEGDVPAVNLADSLRYSTERILSSLKENPNMFFSELGHDALHFIVKVILALIIYLLGAWLIRIVRKAVNKSFARKNTEKTVAAFVSSMVSISLTVLLVVVTIGTLGVNTTSFAAVLAAGGMAIGIALSGTVQNFAGGIMILIFKPFKVGDYVNVMNCSGYVTDVSIVNTKIRTIDNRVIILPNGDLFNNTIDNYSVNPLRRVEWVVSVEYDSDADSCIALLYDIIKSDKRVLDATAEGAADPLVVLSSLNDNDISFTVRAWAKSEDYWNLFYDINLEVYKRLPAAGFSFAYPHMDVSISPKS